MEVMRIKVRKLPATSTENERIRATADNGAVLTVPFRYASDTPNADVAGMLARALGYESVTPLRLNMAGTLSSTTFETEE
jgi:hypothetical protein